MRDTCVCALDQEDVLPEVFDKGIRIKLISYRHVVLTEDLGEEMPGFSVLLVSQRLASAAGEQNGQHLHDVLAAEESFRNFEALHKGGDPSDEVSRIPMLIGTLVMVLIKLRPEMLSEPPQDRFVQGIQFDGRQVEGSRR